MQEISRQLSEEVENEENKGSVGCLKILLAIPLSICSLFLVSFLVYFFYQWLAGKEKPALRLLLGIAILVVLAAASMSATRRLISGNPRKEDGGFFSPFFLRFFGMLFLLFPIAYLIVHGTNWILPDLPITFGFSALGLAGVRKKQVQNKEKKDSD